MLVIKGAAADHESHVDLIFFYGFYNVLIPNLELIITCAPVTIVNENSLKEDESESGHKIITLWVLLKF